MICLDKFNQLIMFWHVSSIATKRTLQRDSWVAFCGKTFPNNSVFDKRTPKLLPPSKTQCFPGYLLGLAQFHFGRAPLVCDVALHTLHIHCIHCTSQPRQLRSAAILSSEASLSSRDPLRPFFGSPLGSMQPAIATDHFTGFLNGSG